MLTQDAYIKNGRVFDVNEMFDVRDIEKETRENNAYRKVLFTTDKLQLVLMCLQPWEEIGEEIHSKNDQFFRIEEGNARLIVEGKETNITDGTTIIVPAGLSHNIINNAKPLKLYTLYSPPHHRPGLVQETKNEEE